METTPRVSVWLLALVLLLPRLAAAFKKGRRIGVVVDPNGKPIEGVSVTATSPKELDKLGPHRTSNCYGH